MGSIQNVVQELSKIAVRYITASTAFLLVSSYNHAVSRVQRIAAASESP